MRILRLVLLMFLSGCVAPLETTSTGSASATTEGTSSLATTTSSTAPSATTSTSGSNSSGQDPCGSGTILCCDSADCYCLSYCPVCNTTNIRACYQLPQGFQCLCVQGGTGTIGTAAGAAGNSLATGGNSAGAGANSDSTGGFGSSGAAFASASAAAASFTTAGSGSFGTAGTGTTSSTGCETTGGGAATGSCSFPDQVYCCGGSCGSCDCRWYEANSPPADCEPCSENLSNDNGEYCTEGLTCSPLGNGCFSDPDCCSAYCSPAGQCENSPDAGTYSSIGTMGTGTSGQ